jgi:hypothetical protein
VGKAEINYRDQYEEIDCCYSCKFTEEEYSAFCKHPEAEYADITWSGICDKYEREVL